MKKLYKYLRFTQKTKLILRTFITITREILSLKQEKVAKKIIFKFLTLLEKKNMI